MSEENWETRLYTMGDADEIKATGKVDKTILVRLIAPEKSAEIRALSSDPPAIQAYTPLPDPPLKPPTDPNADLADAALLNHYETFRDWGRDTLFFPQLSYDSDRGLVAGAIMQRTSYGFQLDPFAAVQNFGAAYSTGTNRPRLEYSLDLRTRSPARGLLYVPR